MVCGTHPRLVWVRNTPPYEPVPVSQGPPGPREPGEGEAARLRPPLRRVSGRAVGVWALRALPVSVILLLLLFAAARAVTSSDWTWVPAWAGDNAWLLPQAYAVYALFRVVVVPLWRYRVHRWEVAGDVIYTRKGWLSRSWQLVPVNRLQTVDHTQGWLERVFGVATLEVQTASYAGSSTIEGLEAEEARRLSEELAVRAGTLRDDAT